MPCTMGDFRPASSAAARSVWIGLWSPDTTAKALMSTGAVTVTSRRRRRGVSVALSVMAPPARTGSVSSAAPLRPRIAKRSSRRASSVPSASVMLTETGTTRPTSVSTAAEAVAVTVNSARSAGIGASRCAAWSRWTRLSRPSTTGMPSSVTAAPMTENTAGQQRPTRASGTRVRPGASGAPKVAVTPVWSATSSGSQSAVTVATLSVTTGRASTPSAPAAMASTARMAAEASSVVTTGMPPLTVAVGSVKRIAIQMSDSGTFRTTPSPSSSSREPVEGCVAERFSLTCHSLGAPMRCTGLMAVRPAHSTSGESRTTASGPVMSARAWRRDTTGTGLTPAASTSSMAACSKRSSSSPTGSSTRVMPATAAVPGMTQTWSAS